MTIAIEEKSHWKDLCAEGLETVVDPMVMRCGELFLKGAAGVEAPDTSWNLLSANIHSIQIFFDALILNEKLPVFNYGDTFDEGLKFDQRVFGRINDSGQILYDVNVGGGLRYEVKQLALAKLKEIYDGTHAIQKNKVDDILSELSAAEYRWSPSLGELEAELKSEEEKKLAKFMLGGLIFTGYAEEMEGEHLLQPKRSRLFLDISLRPKDSGPQLEEKLFDELKKRAGASCVDLPWRPTFFPYLLSRADTPMGLVKEVVNLRKERAVGEYRDWLRTVLNDWTKNGRISRKSQKDVKAVERMIDHVLGIVPSLPQVAIKATIADVGTLKPPVGVDFTPSLQRLWGWSIASLPGKRYRKLLTRAVVAAHEYPKLETRIRTVWNAKQPS